jgi:hypothetical protein
MTPSNSQRFLAAAGLLSAGIAVFHFVIVFAGPDAYGFFGAADLGALERQGSAVPDLLTALLVLVFAAFAFYAFAGTGRVWWRPPFLAAGLATIGMLYTLRGLLLVPQLLQLGSAAARGHLRYGVFSFVALVTGLCYLAGTLTQWRTLRGRKA